MKTLYHDPHRGGWWYALDGVEHGPYQSAKDARRARDREAYYRRAITRSREGRRMTWTDRVTEGLARVVP